MLSILAYASETWSIRKSLEKHIDSFDSCVLCTIEGIKWPDKFSNPDLHWCMQQPQMSALIARSRLHWLGHLLWCTLSHPALECYHFELRNSGWKKLRGKPHTHWRDIIEEDEHRMGKKSQPWRRQHLTAGSGNWSSQDLPQCQQQ